MHTYACISQHKKLHKQSVSTEWHLACILTTKSRYIYIYIYICREACIYIYTYISRRAIVGLRRRCAKNFWNKMTWLTDITAFRLFDMTERLWLNALFFAKQIGEFDWTWFYVQSFIRFEIIHWCLIRWTPHLCKWSKHWIFPPNTGLSPQNWGRKGVGNEVGRVKLKFYTHNFVSFPPTHHMLEGKCHTKQISLIFFECTTLENCNMHYE